MNIAFFASSLVSAYWNGAATYYRGIVRALHERGHRVTFYEPDAWDRQQHRDIADPPYARVVVWNGEQELLAALLDARQAEAARLEAAGNALAAERVRRIERQTLDALRSLLPQEPEPSPSATASAVVIATPAPTPAATATPTAVPTTTSGIGGPVATPTRTPPFTARPTATPTPEPTVLPTPTPAGTPFLLLVRGTVKNPDGTLNSGACISLSAGGACVTTVHADGTYDFSISARTNQVITVYAFTKDAGGAITSKAVTSGTVRATTLDMTAMKLQPV